VIVRCLRNLSAGALALALTGSAACSGDDATTKKPPTDVLLEIYNPSQAQMQRLLERHYINSVGDIFGANAAYLADPPPDTTINGFKSIAASQFAMTDQLVSRYEASARAVAIGAMLDSTTLHELMGCEPQGDEDPACYANFIRRVGLRLFRRPLTDDEVGDYLELANDANETMDGFYAGIQWTIVAMLQSPHFLFQVHVGEPLSSDATKSRLTGYEVATRMAFFLTDSGPDAELLEAAEDGALDTRGGIRAAVVSLLERPAARRAMQSFFEEYFVLDNLEETQKVASMFPSYSSELAASMKLETTKLVNDVIFDRDVPFVELFTTDYTFVDDNLAEHYGIAGPVNAEWTKATLPIEQKRPGILGHASIATAHSHTDSTSVTRRGLFVVERFLCQTMPPPPEDVATELPESSVAPTMRERVAVHLEEPSCAACHTISDPIGLAMENLDPIGHWRDKENGALIDATADHYQIGAFDGVAGLGEALAASPLVTDCVMRMVYRYATGHVETKGELPQLDMLHARFKNAGFRFKELLVEMVASDAFRVIATADEEEADPQEGGE
jgi:hypothetical protein